MEGRRRTIISFQRRLSKQTSKPKNAQHDANERKHTPRKTRGANSRTLPCPAGLSPAASRRAGGLAGRSSDSCGLSRRPPQHQDGPGKKRSRCRPPIYFLIKQLSLSRAESAIPASREPVFTPGHKVCDEVTPSVAPASQPCPPRQRCSVSFSAWPGRCHMLTWRTVTQATYRSSSRGRN